MSWFTKVLGFGAPTSAESNVLNQQWDKATQLFDTHPEVPQFKDTPNGPFKKCEKFDSDTDYYFLKLKTGHYIYLGGSLEFKKLFLPGVFAAYYLQFWNMLIGIDGKNVDVDGVKRFLKQFLYCKPKKDFKFAKGQFPKTINSNAEMISDPAKYAQYKKYEQDRIESNEFYDAQRTFNAMSPREQENELNRQRLLREEQKILLLKDPTRCPANFENYLNTPSNHPRYAILVNSLGSTQDGFALNFYYDKRNANVLSDYTEQITQMKSIASQQKQGFINTLCQKGVAIQIMLMANEKDNIAHLQNDQFQQDHSINYDTKEWKALRWCLGLLEQFVLDQFQRMQMQMQGQGQGQGAPVQGQVQGQGQGQGQGAPVQGQGAPQMQGVPMQGQGGKSKSKSKSNRKKRNSHRRHSHKHHKHRTPKRR